VASTTLNVDTHELAWAAGFFDGEGSIVLPRGATSIALQIGQADRRPLERFHAAVGDLGRIEGPTPPNPPGRLVMHRWRVGKWRDAQAVIALLWPFLAQPKRERIGTVMRDFNARIGPRLRLTARCPHGHPYDGHNTMRGRDGVKKCRECNRIRCAARSAQVRV
jgi:hypothetical protein